MEPIFFQKQSEFRKWLARNHDKESELLVGFYKVGSKKPSMFWSESVDQALCFGWIDGVRKSIDHESYTIRFTPRKVNSIWSAVNMKKMEELTKKNLMQSAGLEIFKKRQENKSVIYAYEKEALILSPAFEKKFRKNKKAWSFFTEQAPSYRKTLIHHIMTAKREATQIARLDQLIEESGKQKRIL